LQVNNRVGGKVVYQSRVANYLKPVFVNLCVAGRNDGLWSELNKKMLLLISDDIKPEVKVFVDTFSYSIQMLKV